MKDVLIVFAHGAGAPSTSGWMLAWRERLASLGAAVHPFDYAYMRRGTKAPDRLPALIEAHRAAIAEARAAHPNRRLVVLAGKSMGGRVGCHVSLEEAGIAAIVCLGYPLVGIGRKAPIRDEVLKALRTPVLFVQGTRDRMAPLDLLGEVREQMTAPSDLHVVEDGDHSLLLTKRFQKATGHTQEDADRSTVEAIRRFIETHGRGDPGTA